MPQTLIDRALPKEEDRRQAKEAARRLVPLLRETPSVRLIAADQPEVALTVPIQALRLFAEVLSELAQGNAVTVLPTRAELTTQQAADLLGVSRPYLVRLLQEERIPYRRVGTHRRVLLTGLMEYQKSQEEVAQRNLAELTAQAQELNLGY
ncbi:MAG TPA: excisionase family DNA-binding protein [Armatimonadota bacterium]|jgi:excisionase family DNA binding protein